MTDDILQAEYWYTPSKRTGEKPRRWAGEELTCEWDLKDRLHFSPGGGWVGGPRFRCGKCSRTTRAGSQCMCRGAVGAAHRALLCGASPKDCRARQWWALVPSWGVLVVQLEVTRVLQAGDRRGHILFLWVPSQWCRDPGGCLPIPPHLPSSVFPVLKISSHQCLSSAALPLGHSAVPQVPELFS